jgi:hypothetical protein
VAALIAAMPARIESLFILFLHRMAGMAVARTPDLRRPRLAWDDHRLIMALPFADHPDLAAAGIP